MALVLSWLGLATVAAQEPPVQPEVPPGFANVAVTEVSGGATDLAWLGGDLLIATQEGRLYHLEDADPAVQPTKLLDLTEIVGKGAEQGLLGVVADPEFPSRPYIYVYYTRARSSGHCEVAPANCHNRVSRFTISPDGSLDPASERPLMNSIYVGSLHNAGDLAFDRDNLLYVTTGDAGYWPNSQDLSNLNGKILRIDRDGKPAPGNPFTNDDGVACGETILPASTRPCSEIFAYGLRNPFRIAVDPNVPEDRFFINDVGQTGWEEIDTGLAGANYGWPAFEGPCPPEMDTGCWEETPFVEPIYAYNHEIGCFAITGGAFVPGDSPWGSTYQGKYLFADWGCGKIFVLEPGVDGQFTAAPFATGLQRISPILFGPDGGTLYYGRDDGLIHAIVMEAPG